MYTNGYDSIANALVGIKWNFLESQVKENLHFLGSMKKKFPDRDNNWSRPLRISKILVGRNKTSVPGERTVGGNNEVGSVKVEFGCVRFDIVQGSSNVWDSTEK